MKFETYRLTELHNFKDLTQIFPISALHVNRSTETGYNLPAATWAEAMLEMLVFVVFLAASLLRS